MSHTPDAGLGSLVKGVVKDVVGDLASIPTEAARQAVGLPSREIKRTTEDIREPEVEEKIQDAPASEDVKQVTQEYGEKENFHSESQSGQRGEVERKVVYQDVSGDQVQKEQTVQGQTQTQVTPGVSSDNGNGQAQTVPTVASVGVRDTGNGVRLNLGVPEVSLRGLDRDKEERRQEEPDLVSSDEVLEWLSEAVWYGYEK